MFNKTKSRIEDYLNIVVKKINGDIVDTDNLYSPQSRVEDYLYFIAKNIYKTIDDNIISKHSTYSSKKIDEDMKNKANNNHTHENASMNKDGLMSKEDKNKLENIENRANRTEIVNDLNSNDEYKALSALKGKELKEQIDSKANISHDHNNFSVHQLETNNDLNDLNLPTNTWLCCSQDSIWETLQNKPNNTNGSGIILNLTIGSAYRTQIYFPYHPNNLLSYRMQSSNSSTNTTWSTWKNFLTNSNYSLEQDLFLLEQDLRIMEIEKILKQDINTLETNNTNDSYYNLLLRIIENINFYAKDNKNCSKNNILNIIDIYFGNKKINKE